MYEFNFSKFWTGTKITFSFSEEDPVDNRWKVVAQNRHAVVEIDLNCKKSDMLLMNYEAPDGMKRHHRLWNGGNASGTLKLYDKKGNRLTLVDTLTIHHAGCEYGEYGKQ